MVFEDRPRTKPLAPQPEEGRAPPRAGMTSKVGLAPSERPVARANSVYPAEGRSTTRSAKDALPALAVTVSVPVRVPAPGLARSPTWTGPLKAAVGLPNRSFAITRTAGESGVAATAGRGGAA